MVSFPSSHLRRRTSRSSRQPGDEYHNAFFAARTELWFIGPGLHCLFRLFRPVAIPLPQHELQPLQRHLVGRVQESEVAHLVEPLGQNVLEKAAQEFQRRKTHCFPLSGVGILVTEPHLVVFQGNDAVVGDGDPVDIAGEVGEHLFRLFEGRPGEDDPVLFPDLSGKGCRGKGLSCALHEDGPEDG